MPSIDHYVLVAGNLSLARKHYQQLGFTVAPDGVHPFGTYNANMYFRDGPMIETLSIENERRYAEAIAAGNSFVKNDAIYRKVLGDAGFSHVVLTSDDAESDHARFVGKGVSGGALVAFSRDFEQPDGRIETISAKLAFATPTNARCGFYFTCEDIAVPTIDRSSLLDHENGALGAVQAVSSAPDPLAYVGFLGTLFEAGAIQVSDRSVECPLPKGRATIMTPDQLAEDFGIDGAPSGSDLLHRGLVFEVTDLQKTEDLFTRNQVAYKRHKQRLVTQVSPTPGPFFAFEQLR